jgi:hypothetical protein
MNIDLVVLSIWNLLTSNSLIQLSPDFNWTPQIIERVNFAMFLFPWKLLSLCCVRTGRVPAFSKKNWQISLEECGTKASIKFTTDQHFRRKWTVFNIFCEFILKIKILNLSNLLQYLDHITSLIFWYDKHHLV